MLKKILLISAVVVALASVAAMAAPLYFEKMLAGEPVGAHLSAVSTDTAIVIRYVGGGSGGGEVAVAAGGDITLTVGGVADDSTECPVSGAYGGVIDVSDASCNTLGEVVDAINFSDHWRAAIVNGLRSDSSDNTLLTFTTAAADAKDGLAMAWDTAVALHMTQTLLPSESITFFSAPGPTTPGLIANPVIGKRMCATWYAENVTTGGSATINIYSVKRTQVKGALNAAGTGFTGGSDTSTTLFSAAGGATGVVRELDFSNAPICSKTGEILVARTTATSSLTAPLIDITGLYFTP